MYNQVGTNVITVDLQDRNNLYKPTMGLFDAAKKPTVCGSDVTVLVEGSYQPPKHNTPLVLSWLLQ